MNRVLWCLIAACLTTARVVAAQPAGVRGPLAGAVRLCAPAISPASQVVTTSWQLVDPADPGGLWRITDTVALPDSRASVLDVYRTILSFHEAPLFAPSREQQERLDKASSVLKYRRTVRDRLFRQNRDRWQSDAYVAYRLYARRYAAAADIAARGPAGGSEGARDAANAAMDEWVLRGHRTDIESALNTVASVSALDANAHWSERSSRLQEALLATGHPPVQASPRPSQWTDGDGWTRCGPASVNGTILAFELKLVSVVRDWLDPNVFTDRQWRWLESVPEGAVVPVSDGAGRGRLPLLPHTLILVRQLSIQHPDGFQSQTPGILAIGWIGDRLPLSPDPRPGLHWGVPPSPASDRPLITAAGVFVSTSIDRTTFDSLRSVGRHVVGPNVYVQFRFAEWLLVGTAAGPHVGGPGLAIAAKAPVLSTGLELFAGIRLGRGADQDVAQGLVGVVMPMWRWHGR